MTDALSEAAIVRAVAKNAAQRIARKVAAVLRTLPGGNSGDDSGLKTVWDELCVQVQGEQSVLWEVYDETVRGLTRAFLADLAEHEQQALWLQSEAGANWLCEEASDRGDAQVSDDDIVEHVTEEYVLDQAQTWSNGRIRKYLDWYWSLGSD